MHSEMLVGNLLATATIAALVISSEGAAATPRSFTLDGERYELDLPDDVELVKNKKLAKETAESIEFRRGKVEGTVIALPIARVKGCADHKNPETVR